MEARSSATIQTKTGCRRQVDLVRLALSLAAMRLD
jgi:hypothetical protein